MNLVAIAMYRYILSSAMNCVEASPTVAETVTAKPIIIEFFLPSLSSIIPTMGENISAATSNELNKC